MHLLRVPALVAVGALDVPPVHAMAESYARLLGARRVVLDGVGHMAPMEAPERVTQMLADVLQPDTRRAR